MAFTPTSVLRKQANDKVDRNMSDNQHLKQIIDSTTDQNRQQFSSNQPTMRAIVKNSEYIHTVILANQCDIYALW